jgi:hypothetical protein
MARGLVALCGVSQCQTRASVHSAGAAATAAAASLTGRPKHPLNLNLTYSTASFSMFVLNRWRAECTH